MNELIIIPNFSEGRIIYSYRNSLFGLEKEIAIKHLPYFFRNPIHTQLQRVSVSELNKLIIQESKIPIERFLEQTTINQKITLIHVEYLGEDKKKRKIKRKTIKITTPVTLIRSSVIPYLIFKAKTVKRRDINIPGEEHANYTVSEESVNNVVNDLEKEFEYFSKKINNCTPEESIEYNAKRLLQTKIELKTHEELRIKK